MVASYLPILTTYNFYLLNLKYMVATVAIPSY